MENRLLGRKVRHVINRNEARGERMFWGGGEKDGLGVSGGGWGFGRRGLVQEFCCLFVFLDHWKKFIFGWCMVS